MLRRQLRLAQELDLPVILHNREATEDILKILQLTIYNSQSGHPLRGVFHCFNGSRETAQQVLNMGLYLGIGGVITFKNCKLADCLAGDERFAPVPLDRLLLETDGPYMAPVPHRGQRNESRFMIHVAERLAQVYNEPIEQIIVQTNANSRLLFSIK